MTDHHIGLDEEIAIVAPDGRRYVVIWEKDSGLMVTHNGRQDDEPSIVCPQCYWRSYHPKDIETRYCGHCHQFHDQMAEKNAEA